ncbi:sigma factor-like helix-turn-helix DNA-binding protein [Nocardia gamkensis]|uniref:sigma factor-like helix-turn-helix DNA-binding protein n=1 Tax=Nocardia gamkensis TaxID=352869 RepID=UPI0037C5625F
MALSASPVSPRSSGPSPTANSGRKPANIYNGTQDEVSPIQPAHRHGRRLRATGSTRPQPPPTADGGGRDFPDFPEELAIVELLRQLPDERREAFVLTQIIGLSYPEAAQALGCPTGTIRSRVARARESLIEMLCQGEAWERPCRSHAGRGECQ